MTGPAARRADASRLVDALRGTYRVALGAFAAVALTVLAMYLVRRDAEAWVVHTRQVLRVAREARFVAEDLLRGPEPAPRAGSARLAALLDTLVALTADNPPQQARARAAGVDVLAAVDAARGGARDAASGSTGRATRLATRERFDAIIAVEDALFSRRARYVSRLELLGLALLLGEIGVVAWVLGRFRRGIAAQATALAEQQHQLEEQAAELEVTAEELADRAAELEASNRELATFGYAVAHDLRAPLRSMDGYARILQTEYVGRPLDAEAEGHLRRVRANAQRMGQMIDGMLALGRLGRGEVRRERVDLGALAESVVADLRRAEPERHVEVRIAPGLSAVGDPRLLHVVMQNLVGNAWKFTRGRDAAVIEIGADDGPGGERVFHVRDDGAGFDMAYVDKLFGMFQRLHDDASFPGTGIGLATVRRIVERHGGRIWAEGAVDRGATFHFSLGTHEA